MNEQARPDQGATQPQTDDNNFIIRNIYMKDISFETPNTPHIFNSQAGLSVAMDIGNKAQHLDSEIYEVTLAVTVTAKSGDKTAYLVEVNQAGIFTLSNYEKDELNKLLATFCPKILFPYARQAISDLVLKGGFPPLILAPVNFDAIYHDIQSRNNGLEDGAHPQHDA